MAELRLSYKTAGLMFVLAAIGAVLIVVFLVILKDEDDGDTTDVELPPPPAPTGPTLEEVQKRGFLRCGAYEFSMFSFHDTATGVVDGFLIDIVS